MRRLLTALTALALAMGLNLATAAPAHAIEWSPKVCKDYGTQGFKVCTRYYTTVWQGTYAVHYVETCLVGTGPAGPTVRNTYGGRVAIRTSGGVYIGHEDVGNVDKGECRVFEIQPGYWPQGGSGMEGTWDGYVNALGWDNYFKTCVRVLNGLPCVLP